MSGDREKGHNTIREGGRLLVHLAKLTSANIVFEITADIYPIAILEAYSKHLCASMGTIHSCVIRMILLLMLVPS